MSVIQLYTVYLDLGHRFKSINETYPQLMENIY
jgi:hypothetical protein